MSKTVSRAKPKNAAWFLREKIKGVALDECLESNKVPIATICRIALECMSEILEIPINELNKKVENKLNEQTNS